MGFLRIVEIAFVDLREQLAQLDAVFHEVVDVCEHGLHNALAQWAAGGNGQILEGRQQRAVYKADQFIPLEGLAGIRPVARQRHGSGMMET